MPAQSPGQALWTLAAHAGDTRGTHSTGQAFRAGGILAGRQGFIRTAVRGPHLRQPRGAGGGRFGGLLAGRGTFCVGPFKDGKDPPFHAEDDDSGGGGGGETQAQALGRVGGAGLSGRREDLSGARDFAPFQQKWEAEAAADELFTQDLRDLGGSLLVPRRSQFPARV